MIKKIISLAVVGILLSCSGVPAYAGYVSRPSISRSYSRPPAMYRPAPRPVRPVTVNRTTVVHENHYNTGSGHGMFTGLLLGSMLSHNSQPQQPQIIVEQPVMQAAPVQTTVPMEQVSVSPPSGQEEESHAIAWTILGLAGLGTVLLIIHKNNKDARNA